MTSKPRYVDPLTALQHVESRSRVYVEGGAGHPDALVPSLLERADQVGGVEVVTSPLGAIPAYCQAGTSGIDRVTSLRGDPAMREAIRAGHVRVVPSHLSDIPRLLAGPLRPDVAIVQVTPPDDRGLCSLGPSVLYHRAAIASARVVIAQVNPSLPRTFGDSTVHESDIDVWVDLDGDIPTQSRTPATKDEIAVAANLIDLVPDDAVVQVGMGKLGDAIFGSLTGRSGLRVHAGLISESVLQLVEAGALADCRGAITTGAALGTSEIYSFINENDLAELRPVEYTHAVATMASFDMFVSINTALQIDMSGQVNAESISGTQIGATGGLADFARGARAARRGLSVVALTSRTPAGQSRIVQELSTPVSVTLGRADVDVVVTECGVADLRGLDLDERQSAIGSITSEKSSAEIGGRATHA